jgi:hypothetical protein
MLYITNFLLPLMGVLTALFLGAATYLTYQQMKGLKAKSHGSEPNPDYNPFFYGNPVSPEQFIGRKAEVRRVAGRIVNGGQSSAITGAFRSGKTSFLEYLAAPQTTLYGNKADTVIFSYQDAKTLPFECEQAQFWKEVFKPLQKRIADEMPDSSLDKAYQTCQQNDFANIEELIAQIGDMNWQLVLMIDEFDVLLDRPHLNNTEFFGGLRQLASRSKGALVLVMTTNISLTQFHQKTKPFTKSGSPYFNFLDEIVLGPLSDSEVEELLRQGDTYFSDDDHRFLKEITGEHPYLLQVAASALWDSYQNGNEDDFIKRQQHAKHGFYDRTKTTLNDIWQLWLPITRKAFIAVALIRAETLRTSLKIQPIDIKNIINDEPGFKQALEELEKQGFVTDENGDWRVRPTIFLSFIADQPTQELRQIVDKTSITSQKSVSL